MIHKIIGGKSSLKQRNLKNSISYLLRKRKPEEAELFVEVLSGTGEHEMLNFNNFIFSRNLKSPYVAGVLSFEEEDIPTKSKYKIIEDFENMAFAGIPHDLRPPIMWVQHTDKGRLELNYLTFNALTTGRSFPVYLDKKDRRLFNDFSEVVNYEGGYSSPFDDFTNIQKGKMVEPPGKTLPAPKKALVEALNSRLVSLIFERKITNKAELIKHLEEKEGFKINRIAKNTVSIITPLDDTPIRLKGDIYQDGRDFLDYFKEKQAKPERSQAIISEKLSNHKPSYEKGLECRAERNKRVYVDPIVRRQQHQQKNVEAQELTPVAVTVLTTKEKQREYNKRNVAPSAASELFKRIREAASEQEKINIEQQQLSELFEKTRFRVVDLGEKTERFRGRFGFFRGYFDRFSRFIDKKLRYVIEFASISKEEKNEQKQDIKERPETETKRRPRFGR